MSLKMPEPDRRCWRAAPRSCATSAAIVPGEGVIAHEREMRPYESDGLTAYRQLPFVVVLPETTEQVARVLRYCHEQRHQVVPRGAGTSLSGGALPLADGVLLGMGKFNRIREIDFDNRVAVVEPGVTNLAISQAVAHEGFYYAPDPSSQIACTIGGNVAENSGGVHCLKYGMTTNNVLGCEIVLITGEVIRLGGKHLDSDGYDLLGIDHRLGRPARRRHRGDGAHPAGSPRPRARVLVGFAVVRGRRRLRRRDHRRRHHPGRHGDDGPAGDPRGRGIRPCRLSARRRGAADRRARRAAGRGRSPDRAGRGDRARLRRDRRAASRPRRRSGCCSGPGARRRSRRSGASRPTTTAWTAPSRAPSCRWCCARMRELSEQYGLRVANVFHAGDGNLHPLILYDANKPGELERAEAFGAEILRAVRRGRRRAHRRARRRRREARPDAGDVLRDRPRPAAARSNAPSTPRACSIPARCFRPCTAAPSSAACTCMRAAWRSRTFRGSERS